LVREATGASEEDLLGTFNLGIGMVLVVADDDADEVVGVAGSGARVIGRVTAAPGVHLV
jgi:phosphoribosylformylglycinamidine cyclo-ligase